MADVEGLSMATFVKTIDIKNVLASTLSKSWLAMIVPQKVRPHQRINPKLF